MCCFPASPTPYAWNVGDLGLRTPTTVEYVKVTLGVMEVTGRQRPWLAEGIALDELTLRSSAVVSSVLASSAITAGPTVAEASGSWLPEHYCCFLDLILKRLETEGILQRVDSGDCIRVCLSSAACSE